MPATSVAGPLAGLRIIDLSTGITGPYASKLFADAGADVVKLESPSGDRLRRWTASGQALARRESGALFHYLNAGKRGVVADLGTENGRALALELVESGHQADLIVGAQALTVVGGHNDQRLLIESHRP